MGKHESLYIFLFSICITKGKALIVCANKGQFFCLYKQGFDEVACVNNQLLANIPVIDK